MTNAKLSMFFFCVTETDQPHLIHSISRTLTTNGKLKPDESARFAEDTGRGYTKTVKRN